MNASRSLERIIEDQIQSWSLHQQRRKITGTNPIITVSREFGALGSEMSHELGRRTGFSVWDKKLVQAVTEDVGGDLRMMKTLDEHRRSSVEEAVRSMIIGQSASNMKYYRALVRVLKTLAQHGSAIVVGRGANFVVNAERALRVRLVGPLAWRVEGYARRQELPVSEAERIVKQRDQERADFVSHYFKQDVGDSGNYDLCLNASRFSLGELAELVIQAYEMHFETVLPERSELETT